MNAEQKVAIITGASQGIGAGLVEAYRSSGYTVIANSRSVQPGADKGVIAVPGDAGPVAVQTVGQKKDRHETAFDTLPALVNAKKLGPLTQPSFLRMSET